MSWIDKIETHLLIEAQPHFCHRSVFFHQPYAVPTYLWPKKHLSPICCCCWFFCYFTSSREQISHSVLVVHLFLCFYFIDVFACGLLVPLLHFVNSCILNMSGFGFNAREKSFAVQGTVCEAVLLILGALFCNLKQKNELLPVLIVSIYHTAWTSKKRQTCAVYMLASRQVNWMFCMRPKSF